MIAQPVHVVDTCRHMYAYICVSRIISMYVYDYTESRVYMCIIIMYFIRLYMHAYICVSRIFRMYVYFYTESMYTST